VRVGVYKSEAVARKQAESLKKKYKAAFVVEEKNIDAALSFVPVEKPVVTQPAAEQPVMASVPTPAPKAMPTLAKEPVANAGLTAKGVAEEELIIMRYAVQLAAYANDGDAINMSRFMPVSDLGRVYTVPEKEFTKVRLGVWEDPAKAESAKAEVVKRGFKEAMVVNEKSTRMTDKLLVTEPDAPVTPKVEPAPAIIKPVEHSAPKKATSTTGKSTLASKGKVEPKQVPAEVKATETPKPVEPVKVASTKYMVRVAAHKDINTFNEMYIAGIPAVKDVRKSGKLSVVYLSGFNSLEEAVAARKLLAKRGLQDAYVVQEEGSKISRVQF
jgi:hypothetical protein